MFICDCRRFMRDFVEMGYYSDRGVRCKTDDDGRSPLHYKRVIPTWLSLGRGMPRPKGVWEFVYRML